MIDLNNNNINLKQNENDENLISSEEINVETTDIANNDNNSSIIKNNTVNTVAKLNE